LRYGTSLMPPLSSFSTLFILRIDPSEVVGFFAEPSGYGAFLVTESRITKM
jgi:hypothetical protein